MIKRAPWVDTAHPGDILLVEQVDRRSRLTADDWERLKAELTSRRVRVVALDLPTSWMMATKAGDEFTGRMFEAISGMLLDMLAAAARKDYVDHRRQTQGQAKAEGRYKGRPEDVDRNAAIGRMLTAKQSWGEIQSITRCSRATIAKIAKRLKQAAYRTSTAQLTPHLLSANSSTIGLTVCCCRLYCVCI